MDLRAEKIMSLHIDLGEPRLVGSTPGGVLNIIPIIGGTFEGPLLKGRVCFGGADWNTTISETLTHVLAKYWIETDDHTVISVENEGFINLQRQGAVIRTTPKFTCDLGSKYAFLTRDTYAGELEGGNANSVEITIYRMQ